MAHIRSLEVPKGCLRVIAHLKESQPASVSEIRRSTGLSQKAISSSLKRLEELDILKAIDKKWKRGRPRLCSLTEWGCRLGIFVCALVKTAREASGKYCVDPYLTMPRGSLSILVHIIRKGRTSLTEAHSELGLCWYTATASFKRLTRLGLISSEKRKGFRRATKVYKVTDEGEQMARYLDTIDMALEWKGG